MTLTSLSLQNFRSYEQVQFQFSPETTFVIGPNTAGKSNLIEAIGLLSTGKSFRAEKELQLLQFNKDISRVKGSVSGADEVTDLEVVFALEGSGEGQLSLQGMKTMRKRFLVNAIPRRRIDFAGILRTVLFTPEDLEIIIASPSIRRGFLDEVLEQVDRDYRISLNFYQKALRQRNALLELVRETGERRIEQFAYWDDLLITHGQLVTTKREAFIDYLNTAEKQLSSFQIQYDRSTISPERLLQYKDAEVAAGVTLVGPHRDDFVVLISPPAGEERDVKLFGSRGQQRLVVLQLKLLQRSYMEQITGERPLLLLDDIFSELDASHIELVLSEVGKQQTIITTTHEEFVGSQKKSATVIELKKR